MESRILTLNLWNINEPLAIRMDRIVGFLRASRPDIIALQEVSFFPDGHDQASWLASEAGYDFVHFTLCGSWNGRREGLAMITRDPSKIVEVLSLPPVMGDMDRKVQCLNLPFCGKNGYLFNTHLAYHENARTGRLLQVGALLGHFKARFQGSDRCVLCGDLNDVPWSEPVRLLFRKAGLSDAWGTTTRDEGLTFSRNNPFVSPLLWPNRRIDYIAVSTGLRVIRCELAFDPASGYAFASDHYGVLATVTEAS